MTDVPAAWIETVERLQGTCGDIPEDLRDDLAFCHYLDGELFLCSVCEWWCELSEMSDSEGVCDDCGDGGDDA